MVNKTWQKDIYVRLESTLVYSDCHKQTPKTAKFFHRIAFWKYVPVTSKEQRKTIPDCSKNLGRDMIISASGQVKIDNLESCRNLVSSDFIVF